MEKSGPIGRLAMLALLGLACSTVTLATPVRPGTGTPLPTADVFSTPVPAATPTPFPTPEPINCTDDACLNACRDRIARVLETMPVAPLSEAYAGTEANLNLVIYDVKDGQLGEPQLLYAPEDFKTYQNEFAVQRRVWDYATALLPPEQFKWITKYEIFTDGPSNVLAWVDHEDLDRQRWTLGVDVMDSANPVGLTETLTHEFGHLVTLNADQIPQTEFYYGWYQNPSSCSQFLSPAGCAKPDSYLNLFYQSFWKGVFDEWLESVEKPHVDSPDEFEALVWEFYSSHSELFVREYAATNIWEDMAESFMYFVLDPQPAGHTVIDQKILFYYDFPELVSLRQRIIQGVCSYTQ